MFVREIIKIPVSAGAGMARKGEAQCDQVVDEVVYTSASRCQSRRTLQQALYKQQVLLRYSALIALLLLLEITALHLFNNITVHIHCSLQTLYL